LGILVDLIVSVGKDVRNQFSVEIHHDGFSVGLDQTDAMWMAR